MGRPRSAKVYEVDRLKLTDAELRRLSLSYEAPAGDGCFEWKGKTNACGYGMFAIGHRRKYLAHRVVFREYVGEIPYMGSGTTLVTPACEGQDQRTVLGMYSAKAASGISFTGTGGAGTE